MTHDTHPTDRTPTTPAPASHHPTDQPPTSPAPLTTAPAVPAPSTTPHPPATPPVVTALPVERSRGCPFSPPAELAELRAQQPLTRMRYPDGHLGWLATGYAAVRAITAHPGFSSRYELTHIPFPGTEGMELPPAAVGDLTGIDPPEHTRYRRLLMGKFTVRRMRLLASRARQIAAERLDAMERGGPVVDLVEAYARPVPALMICELLGVPEEHRADFQLRATAISDHAIPPEGQLAALTELNAHVRDLVTAKRAHPTDDLLSDLTSTDLTDEELAGVGGFLLAAGLDTTVHTITMGTYALLNHPEQAAALRDDPTLTDGAVEELLRYLSVAHTGARTALEDVEVAGQLVRAGETVTLAVGAANRDPERFPDPDTLDLRRKATGHLAFGHGIHQCLGQQLAREELRAALPALFRRFPDLRLAVPPEEIPPRRDMTLHGVECLPVTWGPTTP
ncbi:cytochrome P450 [Streptomyces sp. enrichment culture]|uniref:cytochrome P450 n=1 Tax=Streptomyces sp. enrichment culture TaxID=1795815 RepID=UPI003F54ADDA